MKMGDIKRVLPSYPLFVKDPNFSFWVGGEDFSDTNVQVWWGEEKSVYAFLKTDGVTYGFLGRSRDFESMNVKKAEQISLKVGVFDTECEYLCGKTKLKVRFVSPLPLNDLNLLSMPVCFMEYEITNGENAEISLAVNGNVSFNRTIRSSDGLVRHGAVKRNGFESAFIGLARQLPFSNTCDTMSADWGYFYLSGESVYCMDKDDLFGYLAFSKKQYNHGSDDRFILAVNSKPEGIIAIGYDEGYSIDYYGEHLKGLYLQNNTIFDALDYVMNNYPKINEELAAFEQDLTERAEKFGEEYLNVIKAAYRQSVAAHKLVKNSKGEILWLSKECGSGGFVATADVSYPSTPLYLLYAPELVKGMLRPIFEFAKKDVWTYDFAPHDAGIYPVCGGQLYGIKETDDKYYNRRYVNGGYNKVNTQFPLYLLPKGDYYDFSRQMPVEECANMIIMTGAAYKFDGDLSLFEENKEVLKTWANYLEKFGLKPENQLCTDDFAGHLKNNLNLAVKATVGLKVYAELLKASGDTENAEKHDKTAMLFAKEISDFAKGKTHLPLTWESGEDTFGLKYNFLFDKVLSLGLFDGEIFEKELDFYIKKINKYGAPLDNRKDYTKSDWIIWSAALTNDKEKTKKMISPVNEFLVSSPDRIPFDDWYESVDGKHIMFRARSVQGGCFALLLEDELKNRRGK